MSDRDEGGPHTPAQPCREYEDAEDATTPVSDGVAASDELHAGDTYLEGPYVVFTAQYHLRRGYCCNSDCRHCPYRDALDGRAS